MVLCVVNIREMFGSKITSLEPSVTKATCLACSGCFSLCSFFFLLSLSLSPSFQIIGFPVLCTLCLLGKKKVPKKKSKERRKCCIPFGVTAMCQSL